MDQSPTLTMKWSGSWIQAGFCSILWVLLVCMTHGSLTNKETNSNIGSRWHKRTPAKLGAEIKDDHSVYGSSLPVFSHDFKELFVSATLERSLKSVEDLHVAMILVGHRSIVDNFPFESINTDEKIMYMWSQAIKSWEPDRNLSTSHSDYYCIIQNNLSPNIRSKQAYSVPAYWMPTASIHDSDIQGNIGILRCRIKVFRREIEGWLRAQDDRALFIDVVRRSSSSLGKSHFNHTSIDPYDPSHLLVSFSLPWKTRFTGFGLNHDADTSKLQSWMRWKVSSSNEIKDNSYEISSSRNLRVSMCSGGIRPRNAFRADGSPMLLEFLQQAVRLGVHHVFLGVHLERYLLFSFCLFCFCRFILCGYRSFLHLLCVCVCCFSSRFSPYLRHLVDHVRPFVDLNVVSISTLAGLNGYDDAPGILGVHLHPRYAEWIFLNQCLYFNKGLADYVAFWKPTDFVASYQAGSQGLMSPFQGDLSHLIYTIVHHYTVHHPLESNSSWLPSRSDSSAIANHALGSKSLSQRSASITTSLAITNTKYLPILYIPGNGVRDPDDSFGSWGPGNRQWTSG